MGLLAGGRRTGAWVEWRVHAAGGNPFPKPYANASGIGSSSPANAPVTSWAMLLSLVVSFAWGCCSTARIARSRLRSRYALFGCALGGFRAAANA